MQTTNLISTPNIEGNIGSCEVKSIEYPIKKGYLFKEYEVVVTNSCDGEMVAHYQYVDYGDAMGTVFLLVLLTLGFGVLVRMLFD